MSDSELLQPFFFYLSTRRNMVCHLQHTYEIDRLHNIHCDESCRKALMQDFRYCQCEYKNHITIIIIITTTTTTTIIIINF